MGPGTHARRIAGTWLVGAATAIVILGASIAPFLAPPVVRFEQDRTGAGAATGYDPVELDTVAGLIGDLVLFPQQFWSEVAIAVGGGVIAASIAVAVLAERGAGRAAAAGAAGATSTAAA